MSTTAGALTQVSVGSTVDSLSSAVATGGTAPYTYQWYRSTVTGFSPGAGTLIAGATGLTLNDTGLIPNTTYFYKVVATDSGAVAGTSSQLTVVTTAQTLSPNQFAQTTVVGQIDMRFPYSTVSCLIDVSQLTALYAGAAVKVINSPDGVPKVVGCTADSDEVFGFINFDIKTVAFVAGVPCEVSIAGNFIYLYATTAIARLAQVTLDLTTMGGVGVLVGSSGAAIVGFAYDQAAAPGALIRVKLSTPSFAFA